MYRFASLLKANTPLKQQFFFKTKVLKNLKLHYTAYKLFITIAVILLIKFLLYSVAQRSGILEIFNSFQINVGMQHIWILSPKT